MLIGDAIKQRAKVKAVVTKRGLVSLMNDTKWRELVRAVKTRLPFPPAFQIQDLLSDLPHPETFEQDVAYVGDWIEGLDPFYSIEWIRVRPTLLKHRAMLLPPERIDVGSQFIEILQDLNVPFKRSNDCILIFGYAASTLGIEQ